MVITRSIPGDEFVRRMIRDLNLTEPAGRPSEADIPQQNKEFKSYKLQREQQITRENMRKFRYKGGAIQ